MKKFINISVWTSIVLSVINLVWLGYNAWQYLDVMAWFESPEIYAQLIFIGLILLFFSHIIINLSVVLNLRKSTSLYIPGIVLLILGSVSFIALFFHWGALTDILKEVPLGLEIQNELKGIWISHIIHFSFIVYSMVYLLKVERVNRTGEPSSSLIGEQLFVSLNVIGAVCGATGLLIVLADFYFRVNPQFYKWLIIPYSLFVFIPYLLILSGWFFQAISDKKSGWYDEKQKSDIFRSAAFTLFLSIPMMFLLFLMNYNDVNGIVSILWLPFYLFVILFVFSTSSLYNFKSC